MDVVMKILPALLIPVLLIVMVLVFGNFETAVQGTLERVDGSDTVNVTTNNTYASLSHYPLKTGTALVYNNSVLLESGNYTLDEAGGRIKKINGDANMTSWAVTYTYYIGAIDPFNKTVNQSYASFNLASILPVLIIAVAIITVVLGAFLFTRR